MKISKEIKIGIFVTVVLVLSFIVINFLREKDVFNREMEVKGVYENVQGLTVSAPVMIKGYKAGSVTDIEYDPAAGVFTVTCSVKKQFSLGEDSRMAICSLDIMGGKGVEIIPGTSPVLLKDGATLPSQVGTDLLSSLGEGLIPLIEKISETVDSLKVTITGINSVLDSAGRRNITSSLSHLERALANADKIVSNVEGRSGEIDAFITNLADVSLKLSGIVEKADTAMVGINGIVAELDSSDISGLVTSLTGLVDGIQNPEGSLGKFIKEPGVYDSLDSLLTDLNSLVKKIEENPKKYIRISVF